MSNQQIDVTIADETAVNGLRQRLQASRKKLLTPPPDLQLSEWCDEFRYLGFNSPEPGRWRTSRAPYQKEILDVFGDYRTQRVVVMASAQVGKTAMIENVIGYYIVNDPSPIMVVMPSEEMAKSFGAVKLDPMLEESPTLRTLIAEKRKRDGGNRLLEKVFPGGFVVLTSAKSADSLRSRTVRVLLLDEVDAYENITEEGDPIKIAEARTSNWSNRKVILCSTPTLKDFSRIEREFLASDQRYYHVPCPHCKHYQQLKFGGRDFNYGLRWTDNDPLTVQYLCESCGALFDESHKLSMMLQGQWVKQNPDGKVAGFHISSLYSPWVRWTELVAEWLSVQSFPDKQQEFVNLKLGEPWEDKSNKLQVHELQSHLLPLDAPCPTGVGLITAGVDVQHEWLEVGVWGFGENEQMWLLDTYQLYGDTTQNEVWDELAAVLRRQYKTVKGGLVPITVTAVDAGDRQTIVLEKITRLKQQSLRVIPIKGFDNQRQTFQWTVNLPKLGRIGVSAVKDLLYARLKGVHTPGAGFIQFRPDVELEVLHQILGERKVTFYSKGKAPSIRWVKLRERQEQLDCMVYAYAVRFGVGTNDVAGMVKHLVEEVSKAEGPAPETPPSDSPPVRTIIPRTTVPRTTVHRPGGRFNWRS